MKCPVCRATSQFTSVECRGTFTMFQCASCDVVFSNPMQTTRSYYEKHPDYEQWEKVQDMPLAWYHKTFLRKKPKRGGALLDVGCATGNFLQACKKSYNVRGIDFNRKLISFGRRYYKIQSLYALNPGEFRNRFQQRFDVITCFETLEHQTKPKKFIRDILSLLKQNGVLVMSVPNWPVSAHLFPKEMDSPPHHFLRWNERSVRTFLHDYGLAVKIQKHQFGNWVFTFERMMLKIIPKLRMRYRTAQTKQQGVQKNILRIMRKLLIIPAMLTYPLFLCFPHGGIQLFITAHRHSQQDFK